MFSFLTTGHVRNDGTSTMVRFPPERIKALAHQMSVNPDLLEGRQSIAFATP